MRILTGHWNRHHVKDVHNIVEKIDKGRLENPAQVFQELEKISEKQGVNPSGSFKRRLDFMKNEINQEPSGPTSSN